MNGHPVSPHPDRLAATSSNATNQVQLNVPGASGHPPSTPADTPVTVSSNAVNHGQPNIAEPQSRAPRNSKKSKDDPISPNTLGYYPPLWKDLLEDAKRNCRIIHLNNNPFPSKSRNMKTSITAALVSTVVEWTQNGTTLEPGECHDACNILVLTSY
jgi:hypothetical protein